MYLYIYRFVLLHYKLISVIMVMVDVIIFT